MVKAPAVRMNMGALFGAEVIVPTAGAAEYPSGIRRIKSRKPATVGALRLSASVNANCAAVDYLGPGEHGRNPFDQDTASYR
jgi:hypothetical protein